MLQLPWRSRQVKGTIKPAPLHRDSSFCNVICNGNKLCPTYLFNVWYTYLEFLEVETHCVSFFLQVLLRYNWYTAMYKFKVYSIMIWLTSCNDYHNKFSRHSSFHIDKKLKK